MNPEDEIRKIVAEDPRFPSDAYVFVQEALHHTQRALGRTKPGQMHVGGKEWLEGIRLYALKSFGPMVPTMLNEWNIHSCEDFGDIVFNMIAHQVVSKTEADSREDFKGGYTFDDAFRKPYLPSKARTVEPKKDEAKLGVGN
ncbi:MAG TPA: Minf_1886 family protein [Verrucomicrobiae bacterium]